MGRQATSLTPPLPLPKQDGGAEMACPPLKALLHIMATGEYQVKPFTINPKP